MTTDIAWSWTRLDVAEQCLYRYNKQFLTKEFKVDFDSPAIANGKHKHKMFENSMLALLKRGAPYVLPSEYLHVQQFQEALIQSPYSSILCESQIAFDRDYKQVSWFARNAWLRMGLDLLAIDPLAKTGIIADYKTGKVREPADLKRGQLGLFGAGYFKLDPSLHYLDLYYLWVEHKRKTHLRIYREEAEALMEDFEDRQNIVTLAAQSGNWPKTPNRYCGWCPALPWQCEHKGGGK